VPTASITQQQRSVSGPLPLPPARTNPWQRILAILALVPAVVGAGLGVAGLLNHKGDVSGIAELSAALSAFLVACSFALLWIVVAAINWQIKESTRSRG
jgi:hypothetical protein